MSVKLIIGKFHQEILLNYNIISKTAKVEFYLHIMPKINLKEESIV